MPLELKPPRAGKTPYWSVRGTYLGVGVDRSTKTSKRAIAAKILKKIEGDIERGEFAQAGELTFAKAASAYMKAGGEKRFMTPLIKHFGLTPVRKIDQAAIDAAAAAIYPDAPTSTQNRQVYSPVSAVLKRTGSDFAIKRPLGAGGNKSTFWLWPEAMFRVIDEATKLDLEFGIMCEALLYTGERLSEGLSLECDRTRLSESFSYLPDSKNLEPRAIFLPPHLVGRLACHPRGLDRPGERIFKFHKGGHIYSLLRTACFKAGVDLPPRVAFHVFCHTYGTWMRRYGGLDLRGLVGTGRWKDEKSAARYAHVVVGEEATRAELLPTPKTVAR